MSEQLYSTWLCSQSHTVHTRLLLMSIVFSQIREAAKEADTFVVLGRLVTLRSLIVLDHSLLTIKTY